MSTFYKTTIWLLLISFCFFTFNVGCKKDRLGVSENHLNTQFSSSPSLITIEDAKNYFSEIDLTKLNSTVEDSLQKPLRIKIEPMWEGAFVSNSQSGREIVIVPLTDTTLLALNGGRARAQLVFSRSGPDTIYAQILLYAATPNYHASHANNYNLNDFSGAFVFFDLFSNFQFGVVLEAGTPVSYVDSVGITQENVVPDRSEICTDYVQLLQICQPYGGAYDDCKLVLHIYTVCIESPGGTGGGYGGSGGGSGGGGFPIDPQLLSQYAWLVPMIQSGQMDPFTIQFLGIPIQIFLLLGGQLPPNFNMTQYVQLKQLVN